MEKTVFISIPVPEFETLIIDCVNRCLMEHNLIGIENNLNTDTWYNIDELCNYLPDKSKKATIYGYVSLKTIPYHKSGKKLRFLKSEIDAWLKEGKRKTISEIATEANLKCKSLKTS